MTPTRLTPRSLGVARSRTRVITASKFERSPSLPTGGQGDQPLTCVVVLNQPPRGCCESERQSGRRGKSTHSGRRGTRPGAFSAEEFRRTAFTRPQLDPCSFVSSVVKTSRKSSALASSNFTREPAGRLRHHPGAARGPSCAPRRFSPALALTPLGPPSRPLAQTPRGWRENASRSPRPDRSARPPCAA